jgi:hypothetical protein
MSKGRIACIKALLDGGACIDKVGCEIGKTIGGRLDCVCNLAITHGRCQQAVLALYGILRKRNFPKDLARLLGHTLWHFRWSGVWEAEVAEAEIRSAARAGYVQELKALLNQDELNFDVNGRPGWLLCAYACCIERQNSMC